ncbi:multiple coagulation factor deficiency protein 2 homolog [Limulus polyphemus]|uniref:Multiple coagulation factor deficiency protein 2 homolog n=1 Tax=Limulus polyphemus TaxID=6850 RepID=A0ABM1TQH6_LIMPO|nr:multiple coagulation factor deficiency protein 2 homolog [Limulus polyphemus]
MEIIGLIPTHHRNLTKLPLVSSILCLILFIGNTCSLDGEEILDESKDGPSATAEEIRRKWGAVDIVRDLDHIREDVSKVMKLQETGVISSNEALFYFFRLHDVDNNDKLDGLELLAAINHVVDDEVDDYLTEIPISNDIPTSRSEQEKWNAKFDEDSVFIDKILQEDDLDKDGFLTYSEFVSGRLRDISA